MHGAQLLDKQIHQISTAEDNQYETGTRKHQAAGNLITNQNHNTKEIKNVNKRGCRSPFCASTDFEPLRLTIGHVWPPKTPSTIIIIMSPKHVRQQMSVSASSVVMSF